MKLPKRDALKDQSTRFEKKRHMNAYRKNFPSSDEDVERVPDLSDLVVPSSARTRGMSGAGEVYVSCEDKMATDSSRPVHSHNAARKTTPVEFGVFFTNLQLCTCAVTINLYTLTSHLYVIPNADTF